MSETPEVRRTIDENGNPVMQATIRLKGRADEEIQADIDKVLRTIRRMKD